MERREEERRAIRGVLHLLDDDLPNSTCVSIYTLDRLYSRQGVLDTFDGVFYGTSTLSNAEGPLGGVLSSDSHVDNGHQVSFSERPPAYGGEDLYRGVRLGQLDRATVSTASAASLRNIPGRDEEDGLRREQEVDVWQERAWVRLLEFIEILSYFATIFVAAIVAIVLFLRAPCSVVS